MMPSIPLCEPPDHPEACAYTSIFQTEEEKNEQILSI